MNTKEFAEFRKKVVSRQNKNLEPVEALNGGLFGFLEAAGVIRKLMDSNVLAGEYWRALDAHLKHLRDIARDARLTGHGWLWTCADLKSDKGIKGFENVLPSVDIAHHLGLQNNNFVENAYNKKFGKNQYIFWDSEAGAIYPRFRFGTTALEFIDNIDQWFDEAAFLQNEPKPAKKLAAKKKK